MTNQSSPATFFAEGAIMTNHSSPESAEALKPCPFCGSQVALSILEDEPGEIISAWVHCSCGVEIHERRTEAEAAMQWNSRAAPAQCALPREKLKELLRFFKDDFLSDDETIDGFMQELSPVTSTERPIFECPDCGGDIADKGHLPTCPTLTRPVGNAVGNTEDGAT